MNVFLTTETFDVIFFFVQCIYALIEIIIIKKKNISYTKYHVIMSVCVKQGNTKKIQYRNGNYNLHDELFQCILIINLP